jgi:AcrR family transcriptional regulator
MSEPHLPSPGDDNGGASERRRRAILEATAAVVAESGYPDATVRAIATRARLGVDSFHRVFRGKEEAFLALLAIEERRLLGAVEAACERTDDPASRVEAGLRAALEWVDANPRDARVCIVEPTRSTRRIFERREQTLDLLAGLLRSNAPSPPEFVPEMLDDLLVAGVCEVLGGRLSTESPGRAVDLAPELNELLLGPYLPPPEP